MFKEITVAISITCAVGIANAQKTDCRKVLAAAEAKAGYMTTISAEVSGSGRLYFHTAPHDDCRSMDIFVLPGEVVYAYTESEGWMSVMYVNIKTGKDASGWVKKSRLKVTGNLSLPVD